MKVINLIKIPMAVFLLVMAVGCGAEENLQTPTKQELRHHKSTQFERYEGSYHLIYSENNGLCSWVGDKLNTRLKTRGNVKINLEGDFLSAVNDSTFGFPSWKNTASNISGISFPFANFDINNDGKDETVLLANLISVGGSSTGGMAVYLMPYDSVSESKPANDEGTYSYYPANNIASMGLDQYFYNLNKLNENPVNGSGDWQLSGASGNFYAFPFIQDIQFLKYHDHIYLTMTETDKSAGFSLAADGKIKLPRRQFLVVGEYLQGSLNAKYKNKQDEVIKSSCYFELIKNNLNL